MSSGSKIRTGCLTLLLVKSRSMSSVTALSLPQKWFESVLYLDTFHTDILSSESDIDLAPSQWSAPNEV